MKTQALAAMAAFSIALASSGLADAQSTASANARKYGVAVVDINYIFKNHQKFKSSMDAMKADFQAIDTQLKSEQQKIVQAEQRKKEEFKPGSPEYKQLDEQVVKMKADLQVQVTQQRKELVEREAKIYYDTYREVEWVISNYAQRQEIGLVFRFNGDEADPNNRESILRSINKAVQFQNQVDITPDVLSLLNRMAQRSAAGAPARR